MAPPPNDQRRGGEPPRRVFMPPAPSRRWGLPLSVALHLLVIWFAIQRQQEAELAPKEQAPVEPLIFIEPPKPTPDAGGGGSPAYIQPPPDQPPPPLPVVQPPEAPVEVPKEIPPPTQEALPVGQPTAEVGEGGTGTGGGKGSGHGTGEGAGTQPGTPPEEEPIDPPVWIAGAMPLDKPPDELRGTTLNVTFHVKADGKVERAETDPPIRDGGYESKFRDVLRTFRFKPARKKVSRTAVPGSITIGFQLGGAR